jgi:radical SAM-linked protein
MWYSQGFHPKAVMSFGPALSLGVPSFDEYVDIKTSEALDTVGLLARLQHLSPEGLRFLQITKLESGAHAIGKLVHAARYLVGLPIDLSERIERVLRERSWADAVVTRTKSSTEREVVLGRCVETIEPGEPGDDELLARAGIGGRWTIVRVTLLILQTGTARLQEVVDVLAGGPGTHFRAARLELMLQSPCASERPVRPGTAEGTESSSQGDRGPEREQEA